MNENNEDNDVPTGPSSNDLFEEMLRKAMEQEADKLKKEGKPVPHQPITTNDRVINDRPAKKAPPKRKLAPKTKDEDADVEDISDISSPPRKSISRRDDTPLIPVTIEMQNGEETGPSSNDLFEQKLQQALLESDPSANTAKTATPQTISARLASKNWAERSDAYVELRNLFATATSDDDSCFTEYQYAIPQIVQEKNASALDKGLLTIQTFVEKYKFATTTAEKTVPILIEKHFNTKPNSVEIVIETLLLYIEIDSGAFVTAELVQRLSHKTLKVRIGCVTTLIQAIRSFGAGVIPVKEVLKSLVALFEDSDKKMRDLAMELTVELYRWIKSLVKTSLEGVRSTQMTDLDAKFKEIDANSEPVQPTRFLRSQRKKTKTSSVGAPAVTESKAFDASDLFDPVDVLKELKNTWFTDIENPKWSERHECLKELAQQVSKPKLANADYSSVVAKLANIIENDKTIAVVKLAIECVDMMSKGLKRDFNGFAKPLIGPLLSKFKEKKMTCDLVMSTLDTLDTNSVSFLECSDDLIAALNSKVASIKSYTMRWIETCLPRKSKSEGAKANKMLIGTTIALCDDANQEVREEALKLIGRLLWVTGESEVTGPAAKLDSIKQGKVKEYLASLGAFSGKNDVTMSESVVTSRKVLPKKPSSAPASVEQPVVSAPKSEPPKKAPAPTIKKPITTAKPPPAKKVKKSNDDDEEPKVTISSEEAAQRAKDLIPQNIQEMFASAKWSDRVEAVGKLEEFAQTMLADKTIDTEGDIIVRYIQPKNSKESNAQALVKCYSVTGTIIKNMSKFPKSTAALIISGGVEKLSTAKVKEAVCECLTIMCEEIGPQFVFSQLYKKLVEQKSPKNLAEGLHWMAACITEFGVQTIKVDQLIQFNKDCLSNTNPAVKKETTALLCEMKRFMGDSLLDFLSDVKPTLLAAIKTEFDKIPTVPPPAPTRQIKGVEQPQAGASVDVLPRTDISSQINSKLQAQLEDKQWKTRLEAINTIEKIILDANKRITPNVTDLMNSLKRRLDDANMKLQTSTLSLLSLIAQAVGPAIEKQCKIIMPAILTRLSHNHKSVRQAALQTVEAWMEFMPFDPILKFFPKVMASDKFTPDGRKDALTFLSTHIPNMKKDPETMASLAKVMVDCLTDSKSEIRKMAETIIVEIISSAGFACVKACCRDLKPAFKQTVTAIIDKYSNVEIKSQTPTENAMDEDVDMNDQPSVQAPVVEKEPLIQTQRRPLSASTTSLDVSKSQSIPTQQISGTISPTSESLQVLNKGDALLLNNSGKEARAKRQVKQRWYFDTEPRVELVDQLKQEMQTCVSPALYAKLFSTNFKTQVEGISVLYESLPNQVSQLSDCLDLILKYASMKIFEANTALILRVLELLQRTFQVLSEIGYQLSEYESGIFFPIFIEKLGHNIGTVRETMRQVLKLGRSVCNPRRLFSYILEGAKSKNSRVRTDCLIELSELIDQFGEKVCTNNTFIIVAKCIGDADTVRTAALMVIQSAYKVYGTQIWGLLGNDLPEIHKQMIEEKLKKTKLAPNVSQAKTVTRPVSETVFKVDDYEDDYKSEKVQANTVVSRTAVAPPQPVDISNLDLTQASALKTLISVISVEPNQLEQSVQALRKIADIITEGKTTVVPYLQELVECLVVNIHLAFERAGARAIPVRICKYLLNTTMQLFAKRTLVEFVSKDNVQIMTDELLQRLLDSELPNLEDGQQLLQALNTLMLKLLENTNRTHAYTALLQLLSQTHENPSKQRYIELVVKCLLKLTKALQTTIDRLQIDILLMDLHEFLTQNPPTMFKQKDDLPLRTVKTILNELVKSLGPSIRTHMSLIPTHKSPLIVSYIELMLTSQQQRSESDDSLKTSMDSKAIQSQRTSQTPPPAPSTPSGQRSDEEINSILTNIFSLIGSKDTTQKGLMALYKFQKTYSMERVQDHLARCSEPFQKYILRQLSKLEAHETGQIQTQQQPKRPQSEELSNGVPAPQQTTAPSTLRSTGSVPTMSSVDLARTESKMKQQSLARSDSVASIINRIKAPKPSESTTATTTSDSLDLEALRRRVRAKTTQAVTNSDSQSTDTTTSTDLGGSSLRARMLATLSRAANKDEKENINN